MTRNDAEKADSTNRRRWFRFSLRTLLVVMTIAAVWLGLTMKRLREQERAVARVMELRGRVFYDFQVVPEGYDHKAEPPGPQWIRRLLGPQWNVRVCFVDIRVGGMRAAVNDDLQLWGSLRGLKYLELRDNPLVTDEGLVHLRHAKQLEVLLLHGCNIDGSGLDQIKNLPIRVLDLNRTSVTDDALASMAEMTRLAELSLSDTHVTNRGLPHLSGLKSLRELQLIDLLVDDSGLVHLRDLTGLKNLWLSNTKVTDEGVAALEAALPNLTWVGR